VLAVVGMQRPTYEGTWAVFQAFFKQYGLPKQIHSDNGEPFVSLVSLSRLTRLAVRFNGPGHRHGSTWRRSLATANPVLA